MSSITVSNIHFESTSNNRIVSDNSGGYTFFVNRFQDFGGGNNVFKANSTSFRDYFGDSRCNGLKYGIPLTSTIANDVNTVLNLSTSIFDLTYFVNGAAHGIGDVLTFYCNPGAPYGILRVEGSPGTTIRRAGNNTSTQYLQLFANNSVMLIKVDSNNTFIALKEGFSI